MQFKSSPFATLAAVVTFAAVPALAADAHLVPVPTNDPIADTADTADVTGDVVPDVADALPEAAALPSAIPLPELNGFPRPFPGPADAAADTAAAAVVPASTWSTWCPDPTVFTWGSATISVTTATWVTLTDCPLSSSSASSTETVAPIIPTPRPHPHPGPGPEVHEDHAPEITSVAPIRPPSQTVAPVIPTHSVVIAGASKTQGFLLGVAAAALGLAVVGL